MFGDVHEDDWSLERRAREVFEAVCDLEPVLQKQKLVEMCDDWPDLLIRVEQLLGADKLGQPSGYDLHRRPTDPEVIGRYRIIRRIGEGGMSTVFLAYREDSDERWAVKILDALPNERGEARFRREVEALTRLGHPNLIELEEGGVGEGGELFIVTKFFDGVPFDEYCQKNVPTITARLAVFEQICRAVSFANRREVIHRDLKPANILVNSEGVPKLLDFGVAKLLDARTSSSTTEEGLGRMTLRYAAPEQLRQKPVSASSDVYSLGVILYEMLTSRSPYLTPETNPASLLMEIMEVDPVPPRKVKTEIAKDLEAIVRKALRKEPEGRYLGAEELADDIRRYLDGFPVLAHSGSTFYQLSKSLRRHKPAAIITALAAVGLLGMQINLLLEKQRSERRLKALEVMATDVLGNTYGKLYGAWGVTGALAYVCQKRVEYLEYALQERPGDAAVTRQLIRALFYYGTALGLPQNDNLGQTEAALDKFVRAHHLAASQYQLDKTLPENVLNLAHAKHYAGRLLIEVGRLPEADKMFQECIALTDSLLSKSEGLETRVLALALAAYSSAVIGNASISKECQKEALSLANSILKEPGDSYAHGRRTRRKSMALLLLSEAAATVKDSKLAVDYADEGVRLERSNVASAEETNYVDYWYLARHLTNQSLALLEEKHATAALKSAREASSIFDTLISRNSSSASLNRDRLRAVYVLAECMRKNSGEMEARKLLEANLPKLKMLAEADPASKTAQSEVELWRGALQRLGVSQTF